MLSVLETVKPHFTRYGRKLVGTGKEDWWISLWLDYTKYGREPFMGLTKERGLKRGDLSETNPDGYQVWAVGFYNAPGATILGNIFADPCNPKVPQSVNFPEGTVSVKFLFTDASPKEVAYLQGAPEYVANIDKEGSGSKPVPVGSRKPRAVRLLQLDISVKDKKNAPVTGWVFGTFSWQGPPKGDELYDNLVPASLQWGDDHGNYGTSIAKSWINPDLRKIIYGWDERPTLGFNGRANGPADNILSSCLSCHAAGGRIPPSSQGAAAKRENFDIKKDFKDQRKVQDHVDTWFVDLKSGDLFDTTKRGFALDYSRQIETAIGRMCKACKQGDLKGSTPSICLAVSYYNKPKCQLPTTMFNYTTEILEKGPPPRQ